MGSSILDPRSSWTRTRMHQEPAHGEHEHANTYPARNRLSGPCIAYSFILQRRFEGVVHSSSNIYPCSQRSALQFLNSPDHPNSIENTRSILHPAIAFVLILSNGDGQAGRRAGGRGTITISRTEHHTTHTTHRLHYQESKKHSRA